MRNERGASLKNGLDDIEARALPFWVVTRDPVEVLKASKYVEHLWEREGRNVGMSSAGRAVLHEEFPWACQAQKSIPKKSRKSCFVDRYKQCNWKGDVTLNKHAQCRNRQRIDINELAKGK